MVGRGSSAPPTLLLQSDPPPRPLCAFHKRKARRFLDITINKAGQNVTQKPKNMHEAKNFFPTTIATKQKSPVQTFLLKKGKLLPSKQICAFYPNKWL